jgi:hypothetical protein
MPTNDEVTLGQGGVRLPYVAPFLRDLDLADTEGGKFHSAAEGVRPESGGVYLVGPS